MPPSPETRTITAATGRSMQVVAAIVLGLASLLTAGLCIPVFVAPPAQGYSGLGEFLSMLAAAALRWALLAPLLGWCVRKGRFDWLPGGGAAGRFAIVLGTHLVLGGLSATALLAVADRSMLRGVPPEVFRLVLLAAQLGCTLPAVAVIGCLFVVTRPGPPRVPGVALVGVAAAALAGLLVVGALVVDDVRSQQGRAAQTVRAAQDRTAEQRQQFAALTNADPLLRWDEFVHADVPADFATEALRLLSIRPTLERDLLDALGCDCRNPNWTSELLWLIGAIPFQPGSDLVAPAQQGIDILTANLRSSVDGAYQEQRDTYVDMYLARDLETVRVVALKLARSTKADLRPELQAMRRTVVETYPKSNAAQRYPAAVDRTLAEIATALGLP